ncbi:MAG: hypothetical protein NTZ48_07345, partial [Candidatus Omnitrophica bacterium]|nr:hypothetical protein [Candidatus Omnitrophota bacterium]
KENRGYLKIEIEFIDGIRPDYAGGLEKNAGMIKKTFEHYCDIWPHNPDSMSVLHGDLSLDNVIYNRSGINIIDWEHFNPNGAPWGFDALYLLFETLYFGMRYRKEPRRKEVNIIADSMKFLNAGHRLEPQAANRPLEFVKSFIVNNFKLWDEQLAAFPDKLPILRFTRDQIILIDNMISSAIGRETL